MLQQALQRVIDLKLTSAREVGELAGVSTSTVYRWIAGQSQPDFDSIRLLVRLLPDRRAQEEILNAFLNGTEWSASRLEMELDVNQDGVVDGQDALAAAIESVQGAAKSLSQIHAAAQSPLTAEEALQTIALLNHVVRHCTLTQRVLIDMGEQRAKRKLKIAK